MPYPADHVKISHFTIWFRHLNNPDFVTRLKNLPPEGEIMLEADGVVGRWERMKVGSDGRETPGVRPIGAMKPVWSEWLRKRKGETIEVREVSLVDDYLAAASALFSEWSSPEDEAAFRDL